MATRVENFGQCTEITEFSGSTEEDIAYAKTLWQSAHLLPPMESRLVSSNIKQRMKVATPAHQTVNLVHQKGDEPTDLVSFIAKAHVLQKADEAQRLEKFAKLREEDLKLLQKHRKQRQKKEVVSKHVTLKESLPKHGAGDADNDYEEMKQSLNDIEKFEQQLGFHNEESDSD